MIMIHKRYYSVGLVYSLVVIPAGVSALVIRMQPDAFKTVNADAKSKYVLLAIIKLLTWPANALPAPTISLNALAVNCSSALRKLSVQLVMLVTCH